MYQDLMSRREAAKYLGIAYNTLINYEKRGLIKFRQSPVNRYVLYELSDLIEFCKKVRGL